MSGNSTVGNMTAASALTGTELVYLVQGGNDRKGTVNQFATFIGLTVGGSTISGGTTTRVLYDNAGVLGEYAISGSGSVAMTTSPSFTTPAIDAATGTSLTLTGLVQAGSTSTIGIGTDVLSYRDGANIWAHRNGTSPQRLTIYEDSESSNSIYSRAYLDAGVTTAGVFAIGSEHAGTTTAGTNLTKFAIYVDGTDQLNFNIGVSGRWYTSAQFQSNSTITCGAANFFGWNGRAILSSPSDGNVRVQIGAGGYGIMRMSSTTLAGLGSAATAGDGARATISDSLAAPVFNATAVGGGSVKAPVWSDGTNWLYG